MVADAASASSSFSPVLQTSELNHQHLEHGQMLRHQKCMECSIVYASLVETSLPDINLVIAGPPCMGYQIMSSIAVGNSIIITMWVFLHLAN